MKPSIDPDLSDPPAIADPRLLKRSQFIEFLLTVATIAGLYNLTHYVLVHGFVPLPFVYDTTDTFMDWFNPAFYANTGGAYSRYQSVYAPLSFVIGRIFAMPGCYVYYPKDARDCDPVGIIAIFAFYIISAIVAGVAFYRNDRKTGLFRGISFSICLPMLHALERGQLILVAFIFFFAYFGNLARSKRAMVGSIAMMINMKSYLLFPVLALIVKRRWRLLELGGIATIALYIVTLMIVNEGTPIQIYQNLNVWFGAMNSIVWDQINYSTTYASFLQFDANQYPVRTFVEPEWVDVATIIIKAEVSLSRAICFAVLALAWLYPRAVSLSRLAFFLMMQSFIKDNPGGYGQAFIVFLVFMEPWKNVRVGLAIVLTYLVALPYDYMLVSVLTVPRTSWLMHRAVDTYYGMTLGSLVRPGLLVLILWLLAIDSLIDLHRAMRSRKPMLAGKEPSPKSDLVPA